MRFPSRVAQWCRDTAAQHCLDLLWLSHFALLGAHTQPEAEAGQVAAYVDSCVCLLDHAVRRRSRWPPHSRLRAHQTIAAHRRRVNNPPTWRSLASFLLQRLFFRLLLPCLLVYAIAHCAGYLQQPPHASTSDHASFNQHPLASSHHHPPPLCSHVCTSSKWLAFGAPAHPLVLRYSPTTPDFAPDWLYSAQKKQHERNDHVMAIPDPADTPGRLEINSRSESLARAAVMFVVGQGVVDQGVALALQRHVETIKNLSDTSTATSQMQSLLQLWNIGVNEKQSLRSALAWSANATLFDGIDRQYDLVSSMIDELRASILTRVAFINQEIESLEDPKFGRCLHHQHCIDKWQPELDELRHLSAWSDFTHLNMYVTWHIVNALSFFTRELLDTFDHHAGEATVTRVRQVYSKQKLHGLSRRAGLYAARQWATRYDSMNQEITTFCHDCFSSSNTSSIWQAWWEPYPAEPPSDFQEWLEPKKPNIMVRVKEGGINLDSVRRVGGFPIRTPKDWRRWQSNLAGQECLGVDHLWGDDELDKELGRRIAEAGPDSLTDVDRCEMGREILGQLWCVRDTTLLDVKGSYDATRAWVGAKDLYWLEWVKDFDRRQRKAEFVHEAWGEDSE
ncbi:uncharacterized protein MYCFIDRAFT_209423 [Pseudocercospora fijiensis CIRAD86]|uniref:Uncharacterized protein n=1 Tax=Pseudocercospora fijiensis (strain CIRAD86) TaxID=383855 RepID=M3AHX5_PSEFD|nr:uncharacterized protein MYCFIDRAFT_209423 [Pseudocercospora fijiensis CIRAD86]EME76798.1 hypothetical protein MYCFIDRAFT_209423 [Pseudocercospora fijiensis CIRAD86]